MVYLKQRSHVGISKHFTRDVVKPLSTSCHLNSLMCDASVSTKNIFVDLHITIYYGNHFSFML